MYKKFWYPVVVAWLAGSVASVDAAELYRYVNDRGVTVLDSSVPPQYVSRGYEVLDRDGRVKQVVPPAPSPEELRAARIAAEEQQRQRASDETLLRLYASVADLDRAHARQIQQIEGLIATAEGETAAKPAKGKKTEKAAAVADEDGVIG